MAFEHFPIAFNGQVSELAWTQVTEIKIPRLTFLGMNALINCWKCRIGTLKLQSRRNLE